MIGPHKSETAGWTLAIEESKAVVKIIQKLLRPFTLQDEDWETLAAIIGVAYNDTQQSSTWQTPFYLKYGNHPVNVYRNADTNNPHTEDRIEYLIRLQEAARDVIHDAQTVRQRYAEKHRRPSPEIKVQDLVLLRRKRSEQTKLAPPADGPFQVMTIANNVTLRFP